VKKIIIAVAATFVALTGCAGTASAAPSSRTPVMYSGMGTAWTNAARRPHSFVLGADFEIVKTNWSRWTNTGAFGHGHLIACAGAEGPCVKFVAGITLTVVKTHDGTRYFASMKLTGKHHKTQKLKMKDGSWLLTTRGYGS
jgi:hypothetical protein